jgi:hypothetical protein
MIRFSAALISMGALQRDTISVAIRIGQACRYRPLKMRLREMAKSCQSEAAVTGAGSRDLWGIKGCGGSCKLFREIRVVVR